MCRRARRDAAAATSPPAVNDGVASANSIRLGLGLGLVLVLLLGPELCLC